MSASPKVDYPNSACSSDSAWTRCASPDRAQFRRIGPAGGSDSVARGDGFRALVLVTALNLVTAPTVGLIVNRWVRPFAKTEVQGAKVELLVSPLMTLTVLLLSFVLVQAFGSDHRVLAAEGRKASRLASSTRSPATTPKRSLCRSMSRWRAKAGRW